MVQIPNEDFGSLRQQSLSEKTSLTAAELLPLLRECFDCFLQADIHKKLRSIIKANIELLEKELEDPLEKFDDWDLIREVGEKYYEDYKSRYLWDGPQSIEQHARLARAAYRVIAEKLKQLDLINSKS